MNLPFTLKISSFFYIENSAKKIGVHKSGTPWGGQRSMNFIHKILFFLIDGFPNIPLFLFPPSPTEEGNGQAK